MALTLALAGGATRAQAETSAPLTAGLEFTAGEEHVRLDDNFSLANRSFTVEAWIWLDTTEGDQPVLGQIDGGEGLMHLIVRNGNVHLGFYADDLAGATPMPAHQWVHVAFSYDFATRQQRVFLNGALDGQRTADNHFVENNRALHIGVWYNPASHFFRGRMLELRIWDHARAEGDILADRFTTPPTDAPGLDALFTFDGIVGSDVPDATGNLTGNVLTGATVVSPVRPPALLDEAALIADLPAGSLAAEVAGYAVSPAPTAPHTDTGGAELTDGLGSHLVWGAPWLNFWGSFIDPMVAWLTPSTELTFTFKERVQIDTITLYAANSGGSDGVALPTSVAVTSPGGFAGNFPVVAATETGVLQPVALTDLGLITDEVKLTLHGGAPWISLSEVTFDGAPLAGRTADNDDLSLAAQRYLGLDPAIDDRNAVQLDIERAAGETRFHFPRAADPFGVNAVVQWSTDLENWQDVGHKPSGTAGRNFARLAPPPAGGSAFFRLRFASEIGEVTAPAALEIGEKETPMTFPAGTFFGSLNDPEQLTLLAINDIATLVGETIALDHGGTLQIAADGSGALTVPASMPGGATLQEEFTYTVISRLGETVRRTFSFTITGENDAPVVEDITTTHTARVVDAGIAYRYFEGDFPTEASLLGATPVATGRIPTFSLDPATAGSGYGFEFTGELFVPAAGPYTFYTGTENGVVLDINGERVVENTFEVPATERSGTVTLAAGSHTIRVRTFGAAVPGALTVDYSGPGLPRTAIPTGAFPRLADLALGNASDVDDGDNVRITHLNGEILAEGAPAVLPSGATVTLAGDGQLTYHPAPGKTLLHEATSTENFTYTVGDSGGLSATATASLNLARQNTAPVAAEATRLFTESSQNRGTLPLGNLLSDADGDTLRIIGASGTAFLGAHVLANTLPSTAKLSLEDNDDQLSLDYDGWGAFVRTRSGGERYIDSFTLIVVDSAGATAELPVWIDDALAEQQWIVYYDHRLESSVPLRTVRLESEYNFPITADIYVKHRETGAEIGRIEYTLPIRPAIVDITFDLPEGLAEDEFFDSYDLHIDTLEGDPIYYAYPSGNMQVIGLYSTYSRSFFAYKGAASPYWPIEISGDFFARRPLPNGAYVSDFPYNSIITLYEKGIVRRSAPSNKKVIESTFAANILIEGLCSTADISRFSAQNLNDGDIVLTVGNELEQVSVPAGQTVEFEVSYLPRIPVKLLEGDLGMFDSSGSVCPVEIDLTVNPYCAGPYISFTQVINNGGEALEVRLQSVAFPSLISEDITIGSGSEEAIELNPQGQNIGGTEGRVIILLPEGPVEGPTFTFSNDSC